MSDDEMFDKYSYFDEEEHINSDTFIKLLRYTSDSADNIGRRALKISDYDVGVGSYIW